MAPWCRAPPWLWHASSHLHTKRTRRTKRKHPGRASQARAGEPIHRDCGAVRRVARVHAPPWVRGARSQGLRGERERCPKHRGRGGQRRAGNSAVAPRRRPSSRSALSSSRRPQQQPPVRRVFAPPTALLPPSRRRSAARSAAHLDAVDTGRCAAALGLLGLLADCDEELHELVVAHRLVEASAASSVRPISWRSRRRPNRGSGRGGGGGGQGATGNGGRNSESMGFEVATVERRPDGRGHQNYCPVLSVSKSPVSALPRALPPCTSAHHPGRGPRACRVRRNTTTPLG